MSKSSRESLLSEVAEQGNPYIILFRRKDNNLIDVLWDPIRRLPWSTYKLRHAQGMARRVPDSTVVAAREALKILLKAK